MRTERPPVAGPARGQAELELTSVVSSSSDCVGSPPSDRHPPGPARSIKRHARDQDGSLGDPVHPQPIQQRQLHAHLPNPQAKARAHHPPFFLPTQISDSLRSFGISPKTTSLILVRITPPPEGDLYTLAWVEKRMRDIVEGDSLEVATVGEGTVDWKTVEKVCPRYLAVSSA